MKHKMLLLLCLLALSSVARADDAPDDLPHDSDTNGYPCDDDDMGSD